MVASVLCISGTDEPLRTRGQVLDAVRMLDWNGLNWVQIRIDPGWFLTVSGGSGRYYVYANVPGSRAAQLVNPAGGDGWEAIAIDGELSRLPRRLLVDELTALCAADRFAEDGGLQEDLAWE